MLLREGALLPLHWLYNSHCGTATDKAIIFILSSVHCWHCCHSMRSRVCVTVGHPSVWPSICLFIRVHLSCHLPATLCCCRFAAVCPGGQEMSIDCCTAGAQQQRRHSSKCEQCHVYSWPRKLTTDLFSLLLCPGNFQATTSQCWNFTTTQRTKW